MASLVAQLVENPPAMQDTPVRFLGPAPGEEVGYPLQYSWAFLCSDSKESTCNVGELGSIPVWERSLGGGHGNPLQYSCLENPHGQRSLAGYYPWGFKKLGMTEAVLYLRGWLSI